MPDQILYTGMKEEILGKIAEFEKQKESIASISRVEGMQSKVADMANAIVFLDKQIGLLKWVLSLMEL